MNYIQRLKAENEMLKNWIADLDRYINSDKFRENPMVNKGDINLRLGELRNQMFQAGLSLYQ